MAFVRGLHASYSVDDNPLSKGGVGSIHSTDDPAFVYKKYLVASKAPAREHLDRLIDVGRQVLIAQGRRPGETPESSVNWPVDLAVDRTGQIAGVVLPAIPAALFHEEYGVVRGLEFLIMKRSNPPMARGRIALLLRMAEILAYVDAQGLIHGDVNSKNLAWAVRPDPIVYLIDCDGMVPQVPAPTVGVQALGWTDPRIIERQVRAHDQYSDRYALALAMYRGLLLTPGNLDRRPDGTWPEPTKIPAWLPSRLAVSIRRGLAPLDGPQRPSPREWATALVATYLSDGRFNESAVSQLDANRTPVDSGPGFTRLPDIDWGSVSAPVSQPSRPVITRPPSRPIPPPTRRSPPLGYPTPPSYRPPPSPPGPPPSRSLPALLVGLWSGTGISARCLLIRADGTYRLQVEGQPLLNGSVTTRGTNLTLNAPGIVPTNFRWDVRYDHLTLTRLSDGMSSNYAREKQVSRPSPGPASSSSRVSPLVGLWSGTGTSPRSLLIRADGTYRLQVEGQPLLNGNVTTQGTNLTLNAPSIAPTNFRWDVRYDHLTLTRLSDGMFSSYIRETQGP